MILLVRWPCTAGAMICDGHLVMIMNVGPASWLPFEATDVDGVVQSIIEEAEDRLFFYPSGSKIS